MTQSDDLDCSSTGDAHYPRKTVIPVASYPAPHPRPVILQDCMGVKSSSYVLRLNGPVPRPLANFGCKEGPEYDPPEWFKGENYTPKRDPASPCMEERQALLPNYKEGEPFVRPGFEVTADHHTLIHPSLLIYPNLLDSDAHPHWELDPDRTKLKHNLPPSPNCYEELCHLIPGHNRLVPHTRRVAWSSASQCWREVMIRQPLVHEPVHQFDRRASNHNVLAPKLHYRAMGYDAPDPMPGKGFRRPPHADDPLDNPHPVDLTVRSIYEHSKSPYYLDGSMGDPYREWLGTPLHPAYMIDHFLPGEESRDIDRPEWHYGKTYAIGRGINQVCKDLDKGPEYAEAVDEESAPLIKAAFLELDGSTTVMEGGVYFVGKGNSECPVIKGNDNDPWELHYHKVYTV